MESKDLISGYFSNNLFQVNFLQEKTIKIYKWLWIGLIDTKQRAWRIILRIILITINILNPKYVFVTNHYNSSMIFSRTIK